jgi:small subunit ribosomal protein S16
MPVSIRLARHGAKKRPFYRIVVADIRAPRDGRSVAQVGVYDPRENPVRIEFQKEALSKWLAVGARPTQTVAQLIKKSGVLQQAAEPSAGE